MDEVAPQHVVRPENDTGAAVTTTRTVTFLFTDIEGSTRLWEGQRDATSVALARSD